MKALSNYLFQWSIQGELFANDKKSENPTEPLQPPTAFLLELDNTHVRPLSTTYDHPAHVPPLNNFSLGPGPRFHLV